MRRQPFGPSTLKPSRGPGLSLAFPLVPQGLRQLHQLRQVRDLVFARVQQALGAGERRRPK